MTNIEEIYNTDIDVRNKKREDIKSIIQSYLIDSYGFENAEIIVEEQNCLYNILREICKQIMRHPTITNPMDDETKKRISKSCKGHKMNESHKERIRENSLRNNVYQYSIETGELVGIWPSTQELGRHGYNQSLISKVCRGLKPSAYGYIWSYKQIGEDDVKLHITIKKTINKKE